MCIQVISKGILGTKVLFKSYPHGNGLLLLLWHHGMCVLLESKVSYCKGTIIRSKSYHGILEKFKYNQVQKGLTWQFYLSMV